MVHGNDKVVNGKVNGNSKMPLTDFEAALGRIKSAFGVKTDGALAKKLSVIRQAVSAARAKGVVPYRWFFQTAEATGCSIDWLFKGDQDTSLKEHFEVRKSRNNYNPSNVIEIEHSDIIQQFKDKALAKDINKDLLDLERVDPEAFKKVGSYIKGMVEGIKMVAERGGYYDSEHRNSERRNSERRQEYDRDKIPGGVDRRSGSDRRQKEA